MTPDFRINADGQAVTEALRDRLLSLTVTDKAGVHADTVEIALDDRAPRIALPRKGAELEVWLGYRETGVLLMGQFVVDETEVSGPPASMTIRARSANVSGGATKAGRGSLKSGRDRSWHDTTVGSVVHDIASDVGYEAHVSPSIGSRPVAHLDQQAESNLALLTRLGRDHGGAVKVAGGKILVYRPDEAESVTGQPIPELLLEPSSVTSWSATITSRSDYAAVEATWHDIAAGERRTARSGDDIGTALVLRRQYPGEAAARQATQAQLERMARGKGKLRVTMPGNPKLAAETRIRMRGFRAGVDGAWACKQVVHTYSPSGYVVALEASLPVVEEDI